MSPRLLGTIRHRGGASAIEFAFIAPILMLLLVGIAKFGLVFNDYLTLTEAVTNGARNLALSRGTSTPYSTTVSQVTSSAFNLASSSLTITTKVNGTTCSTDTTCQTALTSAAGQAATVSATYPCDLVIMGHDFAPGCTLSSAMAEMIE